MVAIIERLHCILYYSTCGTVQYIVYVFWLVHVRKGHGGIVQTRGGYGGVLWVLKHPPLSQDNIQESIDIWLSYQLKHPPYSQETLI